MLASFAIKADVSTRRLGVDDDQAIFFDLATKNVIAIASCQSHQYNGDDHHAGNTNNVE